MAWLTAGAAVAAALAAMAWTIAFISLENGGPLSRVELVAIGLMNWVVRYQVLGEIVAALGAPLLTVGAWLFVRRTSPTQAGAVWSHRASAWLFVLMAVHACAAGMYGLLAALGTEWYGSHVVPFSLPVSLATASLLYCVLEFRRSMTGRVSPWFIAGSVLVCGNATALVPAGVIFGLWVLKVEPWLDGRAVAQQCVEADKPGPG